MVLTTKYPYLYILKSFLDETNFAKPLDLHYIEVPLYSSVSVQK